MNDNQKSVASEVKLISDAARSLRILAINARIETAKAENYFANCSKIISQSMVAQARLVSLLVEHYERNSAVLNEVLSRSGFVDMYVTDEHGNIICAVPAGLCGKTMADASIMALVEAEPHVKELPEKQLNDGSIEKSVIALRRDRKGIINIKVRYTPSQGICTVRSFSVVAEEIGELAGNMETNITVIEDLQKSLTDMQEKREQLTNQISSIEETGCIDAKDDKNALDVVGEDFDFGFDDIPVDAETEVPEIFDGDTDFVVEDENKSQVDEDIELSVTDTVNMQAQQDSEKDCDFEFVEMTDYDKKRKLIEIEAGIGSKYHELLNKVSDINQNARLANLLAIRAKIEAAQASNDNGTLEAILEVHMAIQVKLVQLYIAERILTQAEVEDLVNYTGLDEVWGTDNVGEVLYTNVKGGIGFKFSAEGQTAKFMPILNNPDLIVNAAPCKRAFDGKIVKYAGASNFIGGILQIGKVTDFTGDKASMGFSNVATNARKIAENVLDSSKNLANMLNENSEERIA